ncbi:MAG: PAS domain S-box protein [Candidatus Obscuribacter sp.]|nr:PAS domain S-box protein [Candidatus Obscuribacter sp.]
MKLLKSTLAVATIPLCCQIGLAGWFGLELDQTYKKLENVSRSKEVVSQTLEMVRKVMSDYYAININSDFEDLFDPSTTRKCCAELRVRVKNIADLTADDPAQSGNIRALKECTNEFIRLLEWALHEQSLGRRHWAKVDQNGYDAFYAQITAFQKSTQAIVATEQSRALFAPQLQESKQYLSILLGLSVPVSIALSLLLGRLWGLSITAPLLHIRQNSRLLGLQKPLLPALSGTDELAALDRQLHQVADAVYHLLGTERSLIANAAEMICVIDSDGVFVQVNESASGVLAIGQSLLDVTCIDDRMHADDMLRQARQSKAPARFELRLVDNQGFIVESQWSVLWSDLDQLLFCVVKDVTEERKIERLKDDFIELISNNLKTPLLEMQALYGAACLNHRDLSDGVHKELLSAQKIVNRLLRLVDNLLDFRLIESGKLELVMGKLDLLDITREAVSLVEGLATTRSIKIDCFDKSLTINGDKDKLLQTVLNLLSNAIKFSPDGARIKIEGKANAQSVELHVIDQGPGVPAELADAIFKPFVQASGSKQKEGIGLGLAICQMIIEGHGGRIAVKDSLTSRGSDFWFVLPRQSIR